MTDPPTRWRTWHESVAKAGGEGRDMLEVLRWAADEIASACPRGQLPGRRWEPSGVTVREARMRGRGDCDLSAETPLVRVNQSEHRFVQQFTVAHEIGHLLVKALPAERTREISARQEEKICDELAQRMVIPPDQLAVELDGQRPSLERVLRLCGHFEVNPSTFLRALQTQLYLDDEAYLLATWRGHYLRPSVQGFRTYAAAGPPGLYWPSDQRIEGMGLRNLAVAAEEAAHGTFFEGRDGEAVVQLRKVDSRSGHNAMVGPVAWRAVRQGRSAPYLLARLDCSRLIAQRLSKGKECAGDGPAVGSAVARA